MRYRMLIGFGLAGVLALPAWAETMYRCVDASGRTTFTNVLEDPKRCKELHVPVDISIPAPQVPEEHPRMIPESKKDARSAEPLSKQDQLNAEQKALEQARKDLEDQRAVRYGNERNYQKMLDRLKPYEEAVSNHEQRVKTLSDEISGGQ